MALPLALSSQDVIGQARTGTGKTYAFGIPMLQRIGKPRKNRKKPRGLVVVPTRELALQVTEDLVAAGGKLGSRVLSVYGGRAYEPQVEALKTGVDVVVGTPGRLLDLVKQKHLDLGQTAMLVLDEADRMLDLGFLPDIERIIKLIPAERQTMLFSATMPGEIVSLARKYLNRPTHVRAESTQSEGEAKPDIAQHVWRVHRMDKIEIVGRMLQADGRGLTMVFCETKRACDMVAEQLETRGFAAAPVHGDLGQGQREQALRAFKNGKIDVLVATDVAARGIDIDDVTHVVNYDCPQDEKAYVHRIGRTGRAGRTGIAVTFVEWEELTRWKVINGALNLAFAEPVETYSTSPHVFTELSIPEGTKGVLPHAQRSRAGLAAERIEDLGETGRSRGRRRDEREERETRPRRDRQRRRTRGGRLDETAAGTPATEVLSTPASPAPEPEVSLDKRRTRASDDATLLDQPEATQPGSADGAAPTRRARTRRTTGAAVDAVSTALPEAATFQPQLPEVEHAEPRPEAERIVPASPFMVIFQSPDLATDDDEIAPSAATERAAQRRRPPQHPRRPRRS
ncbi:DEAD/DEAH box helicase [Sinosporangium siamense]|uniref:RNA helicase n=1 Tax=Sinosporangium siamense TaxID=1367973 RepID=A0A919RG23_9ACTN|nr:DEAD/DEAH box helicase [Sinosporangium siamense]GII93067.1 DEAD/DEAH box helicase [Sinosporangium siamense]